MMVVAQVPQRSATNPSLFCLLGLGSAGEIRLLEPEIIHLPRIRALISLRCRSHLPKFTKNQAPLDRQLALTMVSWGT